MQNHVIGVTSATADLISSMAPYNCKFSDLTSDDSQGPIMIINNIGLSFPQRCWIYSTPN